MMIFFVLIGMHNIDRNSTFLFDIVTSKLVFKYDLLLPR